MQNIDKLRIHTDGGARGNPGPAAIGVVIKKDGKTIAQLSEKVGETTNNVAEYKAVLAAFAYLEKNQLRAQKIEVYLDSRLVAEQLNGNFKIKKPHLQVLFIQVKILEKKIGESTKYFTIPRSQNIEADQLVNRALDKVDW